MATLEEYLKPRPHKGFKAIPHYSEEGDCLTFYFKNVPSYADRVDELLTAYLSFESNELVGCQIKSIGRIMKRLRSLRIRVKDKDVELTVLFLACRALAEEPGSLRIYERLFDEVKRRKAMLPNELIAAQPFEQPHDPDGITKENVAEKFAYWIHAGFERRFAEFLDTAPDVVRFASLGTTEQGDSATKFRVDYLKPSGAIGFYHPDWVVVQKDRDAKVNWIIETKGRVWEGTDAKDEAIRDWCKRISTQTRHAWRFVRIDQRDFERSSAHSLEDLVDPTSAQSTM